MKTDYLGRKPGDPGTALHALRGIMTRQQADKASGKAKAAPAPRTAAIPAPRAMTDAEAVTAHRRATAARVQSGAAANGVQAVIAESFGQAATSSPTPPAAQSAAAGWDHVIAAQRANLESHFRHGR